MHLISSLVAGIRGAENGVVQVFLRNTANRATWYDDFEGHGADSSGADIPLGSSGEAIVFVAALVDVVVKNSLGTTVREWTDGYSAACVEVLSDSFTGTHYDTAVVAAGNPTNVNAALSLWNDSAGAIDWKIGSGATDLDDALVGASSLLFNVKAYGAAGDGVANDRPAIVAAYAAAAAAGGGEVFFPGGTYRITSQITIPAKVNFRGATPLGSTILVDFAAGTGVLTTSSGASAIGNVVTQLTIRPAQTFTGPLLSLSSGGTAYQCVVGDSSGSISATQCIAYGGTASFVDIYECRLNIVGVASLGITRSSGTTDVRISGCVIESKTASYAGAWITLVGVTRMSLYGVTFIRTTVAAGAALVLFSGDGCELVASGLRIQGATNNLRFFDFASVATVTITESGNYFNISGDGALYRFAGSIPTTNCAYLLQSRDNRVVEHADDNAALTIDPLNFGQITIRRTSTGAQTVTFGSAPAGCRLTVNYYNDQGSGGGTITFGANVKMEAATNQFTVAANSFRVFEFRSVLIGTTLYWAQVAEDTVDEAE